MSRRELPKLLQMARLPIERFTNVAGLDSFLVWGISESPFPISYFHLNRGLFKPIVSSRMGRHLLFAVRKISGRNTSAVIINGA